MGGLPEVYSYFAWAFENHPAVSTTAESFTTDDYYIASHRVAIMVRRAFHVETRPRRLPVNYWRGRLHETASVRQNAGRSDGARYWIENRSEGWPQRSFELATDSRYVDTVGFDPAKYLRSPEQHFGADSQSLDNRTDAAAYRLMLNSFLMAFGPSERCLPWLGVLLLRGPLDRQFTIVRFLNLMTSSDVGGRYDEPPGSELVLKWVNAIYSGSVSFRGDVTLPMAISVYRAALRRASP